MSTVAATHGCTSVPCTICGSGAVQWSKPMRLVPYPDSEVSSTFPGNRVDMVVCPCNTPGDFPQPCGIHNPERTFAGGGIPWTTNDVYMLAPPAPARLSDEDVDRIARRVLEMQREERTREGHDPGDEA